MYRIEFLLEPALLSNRPNSFKIICEDANYIFQADSEVNMMKWISGLIQTYTRVNSELDNRRGLSTSQSNLEVCYFEVLLI